MFCHLDNVVILRDNIETAKNEGWLEGKAEGRAESEFEKAKSIARSLKQMGMSDSDIAKATGLSLEEIASL